MISTMQKLKPENGCYIPGTCANCGKTVFESICLLDDAYAVWWGKCPHCEAINALNYTCNIRGYSSPGMNLLLPTEEEVIMNDILPHGIPTRGWTNPLNKGKNKEELIAIYR